MVGNGTPARIMMTGTGGGDTSGDGCSTSCTSEPAAIAVGPFSSCARGANGALKCWGGNDFGQLGLGDTTNHGNMSGQMGDNLPAVSLGTGRSSQAIAAGWGSSCALLDNGAVKCWGYNAYGQLGLGDTTNRGDLLGEMGDHLPAVDLGAGNTATAIATSYHTCAAPNEMGDNLPIVSLGTGRTAQAIAVGGESTCALLDNGTVKCWGENTDGELGLGDATNRGDMPNQMGDNLPIVNLGAGRTAQAAAVGESSTCALLDDGTVKCWGYNNDGELGLDDTTNRGDMPNQMGDNLPDVDLGTGRTAHAIATSGSATCALLDNRTVKCWGLNSGGELRLGDTTNRGDRPNEMGDNLPDVDLTF